VCSSDLVEIDTADVKGLTSLILAVK
jgi:hypothetical protein